MAISVNLELQLFQESERGACIEDTLAIPSIDSTEMDAIRTPRDHGSGQSFVSSNLLALSGSESGEVDRTRRREEDRLQRERALQQRSRGLSAVPSNTVPEAIRARKVRVGMKLSEWIWEGHEQLHYPTAEYVRRIVQKDRDSLESGEFSENCSDKGEMHASHDTESRTLDQRNISSMLQSYSSYEEMRQRPKKFMLFCLKNDSIRAIVLSYLNSLAVGMAKGEITRTSRVPMKDSSGEWDTSSDHSAQELGRHVGQGQAKAKEEERDEGDQNDDTENEAPMPNILDEWGIIGVEDIYDTTFLELLSHMEDETTAEEEVDQDSTAKPISRPRFDGIVMDLSFYEQLESEYGPEELRLYPSLQYLRSLIFHSGARLADGGCSEKGTRTVRKPPRGTNSPDSPGSRRSAFSPRNKSSDSGIYRRRSSSSANCEEGPSGLNLSMEQNGENKNQARKRKIRFMDSCEERPFVVLLSPLLEKTKVANLYKNERIDGSLTVPIKRNELR